MGHVETRRGDSVTGLVGGYVPPEGSILLEGAIGLMRVDGLTVAIHAADAARIRSTALQ